MCRRTIYAQFVVGFSFSTARSPWGDNNSESSNSRLPQTVRNADENQPA
jgi:hypothetical protein